MATTPSHAPARAHALRRWLRATWLGWLLGVPTIAALALLGEALGVGGAQFFVGAGMGLAVGLLQARALGRLLPRRRGWILASTLGLAAPFAVTDLARLLHLDLPYSLPVNVAIGGLLVGALQASLLRPHLDRALAWAPSCALAWLAAAGTTAAADALFTARPLAGIAGALAYLGLVASGGLVLGLVGGLGLRALLRAGHPAPS